MAYNIVKHVKTIIIYFLRFSPAVNFKGNVYSNFYALITKVPKTGGGGQEGTSRFSRGEGLKIRPCLEHQLLHYLSQPPTIVHVPYFSIS